MKIEREILIQIKDILITIRSGVTTLIAILDTQIFGKDKDDQAE